MFGIFATTADFSSPHQELSDNIKLPSKSSIIIQHRQKIAKNSSISQLFSSLAK